MDQTWPVLLVAALGVVSTLGAAISTQILTTRREERRWILERGREQERWERERDDRAAQWQREDELRHRESREETYTRFMQALWSWGRMASTIRRVIEAGEKNEPVIDTDRLYRAGLETVDILAELELTASTSVRNSARECCDVMANFLTELLVLTELPEENDGPDALFGLHDTYKTIARRTVELMRTDRGLAPLTKVDPHVLPVAQPDSQAPFGQVTA